MTGNRTNKWTRLTLALLTATCLTAPHASHAQLDAANGNTQIYTSPNGVPVVDIANPNAAGLSHNQYNNYNVGNRGIVLNNGDVSELARQSQLAGEVAANLNLTSQAKVILNEVVTPNRSSLSGYTEVLGGAADVVVANPYGITCNGCGFINTPNVTLSTGVPQLSGGALAGFRTEQGDILITGAGLDGSSQDYLALVARSVNIDGQVNGKGTIDVIAGSNNWDYNKREATATGAAGAAPTVAIDSSALGGMYANRIRLISTEAGVGVKMAGDAAAGAGDFVLDASGKIEMGGKISSGHAASISTTQAGADAVKAVNAQVSSKSDTVIKAAAGAVNLQGGTITAGKDLKIESASLNDENTGATGADNNKRFASQKVTVTQTGAIDLNGTIWGAGADLSASGGTLSIGASGATLYSSNSMSLASSGGDMNLGKAVIHSHGDMTIDAALHNINIGSGGSQGIASKSGDILLKFNGMNNLGTVAAEGGHLNIRRNVGLLVNDGTLYAKQDINIQDFTGGTLGTLTNNGTILADSLLNIKATTLNNFGNMQGTKGGTLTIPTLGNSGTLILSDTAGSSGTIHADSLVNTGDLQSADGLTLSVTNTLTNSAKILAGGDLTINPSIPGALLTVTNNAGGTIQAGDVLSLKYTGANNNVHLINNGTTSGDMLDMLLLQLQNAGTLQSKTQTSSVYATTLLNYAAGKIVLGTTGGGTVGGSTFENAGRIESAGALTVNIFDTLSSSSGASIIAAGDLTLRRAGALPAIINNDGLIQSTGGTLRIHGTDATDKNIYIRGYNNARYMGKAIETNSVALLLDNSAGITAGGTIKIIADTMELRTSNNYIVADMPSGPGTGLSQITVAGDLTNRGVLHSGGNMEVKSSRLYTSGTSSISSTKDLKIQTTGSNMNNYGDYFAGNDLTIQAANTFENFGRVSAFRDIFASAQTFINSRDINATRNITVSAPTFLNQVEGGDTRTWVYYHNYSAPAPVRWIDDLISGYDNYDYYTQTWTDYQYYAGGTPTHKPEMVAGGTLTIQNFNSGKNLGGVISAPVINILGNAGSSFTNDALALRSDDYKRTYTRYADCYHYDLGFSWTCHAWVTRDDTGDVLQTSTNTHTVGASIKGGAVVASGFVLGNFNSFVSNTPDATSPTSKTGTGSAGGSLAGGAGDVAGAGGISFGGITITLPTNPNGLFVVAKDPNSKYLVETNPLYGVGSLLSSDYMAARFGVNVDTLQRRLGDGAYEQSLIRQQLIMKTGSNIIMKGENEAQQTQRLMDNGADIGKALGFTYGKAPTAEQLAQLTGDIVWMVETEVAGQTVLAPVVYLSAATQAMIAGDAGNAMFAANDMNLNLDGLTNQGGTIEGSNTLNIVSKGDVTNTSGTIRGGDVSITSTEGNIVNETWHKTTGNEHGMNTVIGKSGGIESTGNLSLDANKNITNTGASISAGGNADLNAGENITFDTIEDKSVTVTRTKGSTDALGGTSGTVTTESSTTQIKSGLSVGGNMNTKSGQDTTFAGTDVSVGGNADIDAGGNLNIIAREDAQSSSTTSKSGNMLSGSTSTSSQATTTNVGSNFNVGGNLKTNSTGDTTIQGSDINVAGDGDMNAGGNFSILDGRNTSTTSSSSSNTGIGVGGGVYGTTTTTDSHYKSDSVGSNLNFGGNAKISSGETLTIQGSNLESGGNMDLRANDVKILEGRNIDERTHTESSTTFLSVDDGGSDYEDASEAAAEDEETTAEARASASASAETDNSESGGVNLVDTKTTTTRNYSNIGSGSNIKSGGNMSINSNNDVTVRGSNVEAGGNVDLNAKNVNITASQDINETTTTTSRTQMGLYGSSNSSAGASADASAEADSGGASANADASRSGAGAGYNAGDAKASAEANANANASTENTVDLMRQKNTSTTTTTVTNTGSSIKAGGNMNVNAENKLNVHGSDMEAGGDVNLKAKDMSFTAAEDSTVTSTTSSRTSLGLYGDASAEANANANASAGVKDGASGGASADASAEAGIGLQGTNTAKSSTEGSTTARTSTIKSGGNMTREAEGKITDEGTQIEAGGNFEQTATEWESKAAKNTSWSSSDSETNTARIGIYGEASAEAKAEGEAAIGGASQETGAEAGASAGLKATYNRNTSSSDESSSEAVTSNIKAGGSMKTTTTGKTSLEGTNLEADGDMELNAESLDYKAAKNTSSSSSESDNIDAELKVGVDATKAVTGSISGGYDAERESETSSEAVVGSMKSGGKLKVNTDGDARFEGTNIESGDDASIKAGGDVKFDAARNESSSSSGSENASASLSASKSKGGKGAGMGLEAEGGFERGTAESSEAVTGSIKSGGKLDVSAGGNATFEGTALESAGDMSVEAGKDVNFNAAKSTSSEESYGASAEIKASKGGKDKDGKSEGNEMGGEVKGNYSMSDETTSQAGSLKSGGNLKVKSGNDTNLEGTNIESEGKTSLKAGGDVNFKAAEDKKESVGVEAGISAGKKTDGDGKSEKEFGAELSVEGGKSSTKTGGSIKAGEIEIDAGGDAKFEGTNMDSTGDTSVKAGGDVRFDAAESSSIDGSFDGSAGTGGARLKDAGVGGGVERQGSEINTGGNLKIESGGKTTFTGTDANVEGSAHIKAGDGIEKNSAVSGSGQIGTSRGGAHINVDQTNINANGGKTESSGQ